MCVCVCLCTWKIGENENEWKKKYSILFVTGSFLALSSSYYLRNIESVTCAHASPVTGSGRILAWTSLSVTALRPSWNLKPTASKLFQNKSCVVSVFNYYLSKLWKLKIEIKLFEIRQWSAGTDFLQDRDSKMIITNDTWVKKR